MHEIRARTLEDRTIAHNVVAFKSKFENFTLSSDWNYIWATARSHSPFSLIKD